MKLLFILVAYDLNFEFKQIKAQETESDLEFAKKKVRTYEKHLKNTKAALEQIVKREEELAVLKTDLISFEKTKLKKGLIFWTKEQQKIT